MKKIYILLLLSFLPFFTNSSFCQCWEEVNLNVNQQIIPDLNNRRVYFLNDSIGFVFSEKYIFKTSDGGNSWIIKLDKLLIGNSIHFLNDSVGLYGTQAGLYKTTDQGENWIKISEFLESPLITPLVQDIFFLDSLKAFAVGNDRMILKSTDGGYNWEEISSPTGVIVTPWDIDFIDELNGFAGSATNQFYKTNNGGETWDIVRYQGTDPGISNFEMFDSLNGVGIIGNGALGYTQDGWRNFSIYPLSIKMNKICKTPNNIYWVAGRRAILKSQDFGITWQNTLTQPNNVNFNDIHFSSNLNGWAVGRDYAIWKYKPTPPSCVQNLFFPQEGSIDVSITPKLVWSSMASGCIEGYYISLGTSSDSLDLMNRHFVGLDTSFTPNFELPYETDIFVKIEPFNSLYFANGCKDFLFRTEVCKDTILTFIDTSLKKNQVFLGQLWEQDTFFQVALKAINNCDSIIYYNIVVDRSGTLKTNKDSQISLYPNPTTNTLQFQFADHLKLNQIEVFSLNGKLQFKLEEIQSREINLQILPAGMYTIRFVFEGGVVSRKVCKN